MRFPLTRRSALLTGVAGIALTALCACGLRIDADPVVPDLDTTDRLRNRIARILAATTPQPDDPESAGTDLPQLIAAIGPVWAPPTELAAEPAPTEPARTFAAAAAEVSQAVLPSVASLRTDLAPVLVDAAIGMVLIAGSVDRSLVAAAHAALEKAAIAAPSGASAAPSRGADRAEEPAGSGSDETDAGASAPAEARSHLLQAARAAEFGYETLAPRFPPKSTLRTTALDRVTSLEAVAGDTLAAMADSGDDVPRDHPSWTLDPEPTTDAAARTLAARLEDGIAAALLPHLGGNARSALHLWNSARARAAFSSPQALRYTYSDAASTSAGSPARPRPAATEKAGS